MSQIPDTMSNSAVEFTPEDFQAMKTRYNINHWTYDQTIDHIIEQAAGETTWLIHSNAHSERSMDKAISVREEILEQDRVMIETLEGAIAKVAKELKELPEEEAPLKGNAKKRKRSGDSEEEQSKKKLKGLHTKYEAFRQKMTTQAAESEAKIESLKDAKASAKPNFKNLEENFSNIIKTLREQDSNYKKTKQFMDFRAKERDTVQMEIKAHLNKVSMPAFNIDLYEQLQKSSAKNDADKDKLIEELRREVMLQYSKRMHEIGLRQMTVLCYKALKASDSHDIKILLKELEQSMEVSQEAEDEVDCFFTGPRRKRDDEDAAGRRLRESIRESRAV